MNAYNIGLKNDYELNIAVAKKLGLKPDDDGRRRSHGDAVWCDTETAWLDFINSDTVCMPLAWSKNISMKYNQESKMWTAYTPNNEVSSSDSAPRSAIAKCFLEICD